MKQMNNDSPKTLNIELRKNIRKSVITLEKYNYNQKEFTSPEMIQKIKFIIEREVNRNDNK